MDLSVWLLLGSGAAVVVLLTLSAFFSASEIAIFSLERHRLDGLVEEGRPGALTLRRLRENPHRLLVTILVGNNIVNVALASLVSVILALVLSPEAAVVVGTVGISALVLLFGEITPKSYGVANSEALSLRVASPVALVGRALAPLVWLFDAVSGWINRLTGGGGDIERPYVTREEIESLLRSGERVGAIGETEREMVEGVFDLSTTTAREIMVPRVNVVGVDVNTPLDEILSVCADRRLTRVLVYDDTLDHVVGIADVRDVERAVQRDLPLRDVLLPTLQVPEGREIDDLLEEMQAERVPMVVVRDEFGETEGILTVEDILEEIVGEIFEVGEERFIRPTHDGLVAKGEVTVGEVNDALGVELSTEGEYETVAGLINAELGRIGDIGDSIRIDGVSLTVERIDGHRIRRVRVRRLPSPEGTDAGATGGAETGTADGRIPEDAEAPDDAEEQDDAGAPDDAEEQDDAGAPDDAEGQDDAGTPDDAEGPEPGTPTGDDDGTRDDGTRDDGASGGDDEPGDRSGQRRDDGGRTRRGDDADESNG